MECTQTLKRFFLLTHAPSWKRAQCEDVVKAIAAKDVDAAQSAAARPAPASQEEATRTKVLKCPGLRGEVKSKDGKQVIFCKVCKKDYSFAGWGQHCSKSHKGYIPLADRSENIDDRDDDDEIRETADARDGTDGQTVDVLPEINDASQKEPERRHGSKEPKAATSKRRQKDSVEKQDTGAKKAKSKAAPAKKLRPA